MTNNFMDNVRLEVETPGLQNMLSVSANTAVDPDAFFPAVTNGEFATVTTGWTAGSGWTLTRLAGPPTRGHLVKSANVAAGSLIVQNTQHFTAAPGEIWQCEVTLMRVSTSPASVNMAFRINVVAYDASNVRLGVVAGYNGTNKTTDDGASAPGDINGDLSWVADWSAVTPAGTAYVTFELLAHNAWTYVATPFQVDIHGFYPFRYAKSTPISGGWTVTNGAARGIPEGGWRVYSGGTGQTYFESDKVTVTPGKFLGVGATVNSYSTGDYVGIRYYNASNVFISETVGAKYYPIQVPVDTDLGTYYQPLAVRGTHSSTVPVGAAKATVIVKAETSAYYDTHDYTYLVMIQGDTAEDIADTSYANTVPANANNRIMNSSGELGAQGWSDYGFQSVVTTRDALPPNANAFGFRFNGAWDNYEEPLHKEIIVAQTAAGNNVLYSNTTEIVAGQYIGGRVLAKGRGFVRPPYTNNIHSYISVGWQFRNAADAVISTVLSDSVMTQNDYYQMIYAPSTLAPAGTVRARMVIQNSNDPATFTSQAQYAWMMIKQAQMNVGASSASVTKQPLAYAEHWQNVLGPTHSIEVNRNELDVGTLNAEILDPALDPATTTELKPGYKVRLRTLVDDIWQTTFYGNITNLSTEYDVDNTTGVLTPRIHLEAADQISLLSNTTAISTVGTINGLAAYIPSNMRWNINGQTAIGANPPVIARNQSASMLDQVIITRDTEGGYAWMDRTGVFNAWSPGAFDLYKDKAWFLDTARPAKTGKNENLLVNPTFGADTTAWAANGGVLTWNSTTKSAVVTATGGVGAYAYVVLKTGLVEGQVISAVVDRTVSAGKFCKLSLIFFDINAAVVSQTDSYTSQITATAPTDAVWVRLYINLHNDMAGANPSAGAVLTVNQATIVADPTADWAYEQITGEDDYAYWTGAVNASTSIKDYGLYQDYLTNIDIGYNTHEVINDVTVKRLEFIASGETVEVAYGPYVDTTSIALWGSSKLEVTVAGASPATVGARILASNATPILAVKSLTFLVDDIQSFNKAASLDLYDQVQVVLTGKINKALRISGINHRLTAGIKRGLSDHRWEVTIYFKALDTAAQMTGNAPKPSPAAAGAWHTIGGVGEPAFQNSWTAVSGYTAQFRMDQQGNVHIRGQVQSGADLTTAFTLPAGYWPSATGPAALTFVTSANGGQGWSKIDVFRDTGVVRIWKVPYSGATAVTNVSIQCMFPTA